MELKSWIESERGRSSALALYLKVPPSFVSKMVSGEKQIPLEQCVPIERATDGAVTCEELRPDKIADFAYLRGLPDAENTEPKQAPALIPRAQAAIQTIAPADNYTGPERRTSREPNPHADLERRAPLAAALAGQGG